MAEVTPVAGPSRPYIQQRSVSDSIPVNVYAQFEAGRVGRDSVEEDEVVAKGRVSMYVKIVDEMIDTVLSKEAYLLSKHELRVIQRFRALAYEPKYLLTRLLLRKTNKIFAFSELKLRYSSELGHHLTGAMEELVKPIAMVGEDEQTTHAQGSHGEEATQAGRMNGAFSAEELRRITLPSRAPTPDGSDVQTNADAGPSNRSRVSTPLQDDFAEATSWRDVPSGLPAEEERADPELARAMKMSRWEVIKSERSEKSVSGGASPVAISGSASPAKGKGKDTSAIEEDNFYKMKEGSTDDITSFAHGEDDMRVEEMIKYLGVSELTAIAKDLKCWKSKYTRGDIIQSLLNSASKQSRLAFSPLERSETASPRQGRQTTLPFSPVSASPSKKPRTGRSILLDKVIQQLGGKAIQISLPFRLLISRINLIYYRTTITPQSGVAKSLMLPEILTSSHKRAYPSEIRPHRSIVWQTRDALLEYERALEMEAIVDESLGEQNHSSGAWVGPSGYGFGTTGGRVEGARRVRKVWEGVYAKWKAAAHGEGSGKVTGSRHILDRFTLGHILTRVVSKGAVALGVLHEYDLECEVLRSLLTQRVWRRGKRGAWYDRLALVLMNHCGGDIKKKEEAVQVCIDGLMDEDTHLIYRPRLSRRLKRLENQLSLPADERHICEAELRKSSQRVLKAHRVRAPPKNGQQRPAGTGGDEDEDGGVEGKQTSGKSWWTGREGEVGVEQWVLEWWENRGYKGFHSESSILTTLFALLFWPILYKDIPGAFETPYQLAPLDLGDDSFYQSRRDDIEDRLERMTRKGEALKMLREADGRERDRGTLGIGVRWDFGREDLEEIVQCLGGKALSVICRMFCEEYGHRASGVPDLIVWHADKKVCRFVEVKSPNDTLSETQKVWISVLLSAGIDVEVCHVAEDNDTAPLKAAKKRKLNNGKRSWGGQERYDYNGTHDADEDEDEDEDEDDDDEFKYESGGEGKGEGRLLSRAESEAVRKQRRENSENIEPDGNADMKPSFRGARNGSVPARTSLRKMGSGCEVVVLGDSAAQPIEIL